MNTQNPNPASLSDSKKKKQKYSYTAMTSTALVIVAILILNAVFVVLGNKINLKLDLTKDSILSFSETTQKVIDELDDDVNIISLIPAGDTNREMIQIDQVLQKYDLASDRISYQRVDADKNPAILSKYPLDGKPLDGSYYVIFESERMHHAVSVNDLLIMYANQSHEDIVLSGALKAEQFFSSALVKVTKGSRINALVSKGHGEGFDAEDFSRGIFPGSGYSFKDISLATQDIPSDTNVLIIASPQSDYSPEEINKIDAFARSGGDIQIILDADTAGLEGLFAYMSEWGIIPQNGVAADADAGSYAGSKVNIIAQLVQNEVTGIMGIEGQDILFPFARPIELSQRVGITAKALATTGDKGYVKSNVYFTDDSPETGDINQKSNLAVIATKQNSIESISHMSVIGTSYFAGSAADGSFAILDSTANRKFLAGIMNYMTDQPSNFYIMPKNIVQNEVVINQLSIYAYTMLTVVLIPLIIIAWGIITWLRRRHS